MIHRIEPTPENLMGMLSRERKPVHYIDSGDTIIAGTRCCSWGIDAPSDPIALPEFLPLSERKDPAHDEGNCLVGPIAVRGAKPGMTLEIDIEDMKLGAYGLSIRGGAHRERYSILDLDDNFRHWRWTFDREAGTATNPIAHTIKLNPFLGCIGVTLDEPGYHDNLAPHQGGGNLDCRDLVPDSTLYLPVQVPEALLYFGDGHAAQSDGEIGGSAIECPMDDVTLTVKLRDDIPIKWPVARTPSAWITFGCGKTIDEAMYIALNGMFDLMSKNLVLNREEASMLASMIVDLRITQMVNPIVGVHAVWPNDALV